MAARRTTTAKVQVPIPPTANGSGSSINNNNKTSTSTSTSTSSTASSKMDTTPPPPWHSPYLPTPLETALLAIYPGTLLLGSLFSALHPASRNATYLPESQAYAISEAPSYFAKKSNIFNVYFVKIGWFWITLAFTLFTFTHSSLGPPLRPVLTKRRIQATLRYVVVTMVWIFITQWFFGPPIIDRSFRWTGGVCAIMDSDSPSAMAEKEEMSDVREIFTHAACKGIGGKWKGGHDISGHVFLLILGSAMLWLELLPAVLRMEGLREARRIVTQGGLVRSAAVETQEMEPKVKEGSNMEVPEKLGVGVRTSLFVAGLSWWMLLMTAAYFHTWFEKFTGFLVAFTTIYIVYFLPRAVPAMRQVIGMPGV